jgi:hypothetical protein
MAAANFFLFQDEYDIDPSVYSQYHRETLYPCGKNKKKHQTRI